MLLNPTASALDRVMQCTASHVLPRVHETGSTWANRGAAVHRFIQAARLVGRDKALAECADVASRVICAKIDLSLLPPGLDSEVALAWDPRTGKARILGYNIGRDYQLVPGEWAGTADLAGMLGDTVYVGDFKTGRKLRPAAQSWQLRALALYAARATGARSARVQMIYLWHDEPYCDVAEFDSIDLDLIARALKSLRGRLETVALEYAAGRTPDTYPSDDACAYCEAKRACPAKVALVRWLASHPTTEEAIETVTPETAGQVWQRVKDARAILDVIEAGLRAYVRDTDGLPLPSGKVLREVVGKRREINGKVALPVLLARFGAGVADAACEVTTSRAAIERALTQGGFASGAILDAMAAIERHGGITVGETRALREVRP